MELQNRQAKPKVVHPKKKEDALLRKRIEKDKAKDQQDKLDQRVYILQSEWQALCEQAGVETDEKIEQQLSQGDLESDGMQALMMKGFSWEIRTAS